MSVLDYSVRVVNPGDLLTEAVAYGHFVDGIHVTRAQAEAAALAGRRVELRRVPRPVAK